MSRYKDFKILAKGDRYDLAMLADGSLVLGTVDDEPPGFVSVSEKMRGLEYSMKAFLVFNKEVVINKKGGDK
tara:strand:+ start:372 stop:587 length:216 start_codon:yes stop_codon:yes gene_type:complete